MNKKYNRVKAQIDLTAIRSNMEALYHNLPGHSSLMGIIKADGYGHGCERIGQMLEELSFVWGYGVATGDEALELKAVPLHKPVLVLGCVFPDQYDAMIENEVRMNVYTYDMAVEIAERAAALNLKAYVHVKIDSGMNRLGFSCTQESIDQIEALCQLPELETEGIFTHFSKADEADKAFTEKQINSFNYMIDALHKRGISFPLVHAANSAGIIDFGSLPYPLVRAGIAMYGLYPSEEVDRTHVRLKPALSLKSRVIMVKDIHAGDSVSYGGLFTADHTMRIATVPVGYGDGYPRSLSEKGSVLIRGKRAKILGRVCMDQFMVDVSDIPDVSFLDPVTLIGTDGDEEITVEELAQLSGRFNYEFVCDLNKRIPRVYFEDGRIVASVDYF